MNVLEATEKCSSEQAAGTPLKIADSCLHYDGKHSQITNFYSFLLDFFLSRISHHLFW